MSLDEEFIKVLHLLNDEYRLRPKDSVLVDYKCSLSDVPLERQRAILEKLKSHGFISYEDPEISYEDPDSGRYVTTVDNDPRVFSIRVEGKLITALNKVQTGKGFLGNILEKQFLNEISSTSIIIQDVSFEPFVFKDVTIQFIDGENVKIFLQGKTLKVNYKDMGMQDGRNMKPNTSWKYLVALSEMKGIAEYKSWNSDSTRKRKQEVSDSLRKYFNIEEDPFELDSVNKELKIKIELLPVKTSGRSIPPSLQDEFKDESPALEQIGNHEDIIKKWEKSI